MNLLQQRERANLKKRDIEVVLATAYTVSCDIMRNMLMEAEVAGSGDSGPVKKFIEELHQLIVYSRDTMLGIRKKYNNCAIPPDLEHISQTFFNLV